VEVKKVVAEKSTRQQVDSQPYSIPCKIFVISAVFVVKCFFRLIAMLVNGVPGIDHIRDRDCFMATGVRQLRCPRQGAA
jgi:hypothetical protein